MVSEATVRTRIWPETEKLITATLAEDDDALRDLLVPRSEAALLHHLFGFPVFDLLLKTVLGREQLALTRAIETDKGKYVHIEFVWPDPGASDASYTAADIVSVQLRRYKGAWRVVAVNPAATDFPLTEPRAQGILVSAERAAGGKLPQEPWILPVALFAGSLQLPLRDRATAEPVLALLLPGMQQRSYGALSLVGAFRLWHDFTRKASPDPGDPAAWAGAVEFIMSEQNLRELTQAAVGKYYGVSLTAMLPRIRQIKEILNLHDLDARYSALGGTQVVLRDKSNGA
ncbi:MAG: hypothetical protein RRC07_14145 [Anaerolineae bacterium]|nr:hypothetical protein [Anaerolineae bacterium]